MYKAGLLSDASGTMMVMSDRGPSFVMFYVDGGVKGRNPSPRGVYWSIRCEEKDASPVTIRKDSQEYHTNNDAEWLALREALHYACEHHTDRPIVIYSDSRLVVNQFNGKSAAYEPRMIAFRDECQALVEQLKWVAVMWRSREKIVEKLGH